MTRPTGLLLIVVVAMGCGQARPRMHATDVPAEASTTPDRLSSAHQTARAEHVTGGAPLEERLEGDGDLACRISFQQTSAAIASSPRDLDTGEFPPLELASEDVFMNDCLQLPRMVQKCQVFAYVAAHYSECIAARRAYDMEMQQLARIRHASLGLTSQ